MSLLMLIIDTMYSHIHHTNIGIYLIFFIFLLAQCWITCLGLLPYLFVDQLTVHSPSRLNGQRRPNNLLDVQCQSFVCFVCYAQFFGLKN